MAFVPQTSNVFPSMSVEENLEMGAFLRRDDISVTMEQVFELFPILAEKRAQNAGELVWWSTSTGGCWACIDDTTKTT